MKFMKTNIAKIVATVNRMNIITRIIISHGMRYNYAYSAPLRRYRCCGPVFFERAAARNEGLALSSRNPCG